MEKDQASDPDDSFSSSEPLSALNQETLAANWRALSNEGTVIPSETAIEKNQQTHRKKLNQGEIDKLLGTEDSYSESGGLENIISSSLVNYERLPMLEVVFDRLLRLLSGSLRSFTSDNFEVDLESVSSIRFGDYLKSIPQPAMLGIFKAEEWDNYGLIMVDSSSVSLIVDVLLGGRHGDSVKQIENRSYTNIEINLVERMLHIVLADLSSAFDPLTPIVFRFDRLETNPRFATIARPSNAALVVVLNLEMENRKGNIELLLPYATLEPIREILLQMFLGEKFGHDSIWEDHLTNELWHTELDVYAVIKEKQFPLGQVLSWREGTVVDLGCPPHHEIELRCGSSSLYMAQAGKRKGSIAVRLTQQLIHKEKHLES